jgi:Sugar phosphate isomerases/epimerases
MNRRELLTSMPLLAAAALSAAPNESLAKKSRLRTAICAYSFRDALKAGTMTYADLVHMAVEHDVDGLDLTVYWFPNTTNDFLLPLRRLAYRSGVEIYSISVRSEMTRPTPELRDKEVAEVKKWVDVAEKLGAGHIRVFGGSVPKGISEDVAASWVVEVLKRSAEYAATKGIILGLENHGGITERAERIIDIVKKVDSPWVAINLDTGNFNRNVFPQIEMCLPYAANVQVKAEMRDESGARVRQDWNKVVQMIAKSGYKGYLALEYEAKEDPAVAVPRMMKELRALTRKYSA